MPITPADRAEVAHVGEILGLEHLPYEFGKSGKHDDDCSGLVVAAWSKVPSVTMPHNAAQIAEQYGIVAWTNDNAAKMLPGDVITYYSSIPSEVSHVALFIRKVGPLYVVAQATNVQYGTELIRAHKYAPPTGICFVEHD